MAKPELQVNVPRNDPYKSFKFRIKWGGKYVAGVSKVSGLTRTTQVVKHREGGSPSFPQLSPGQTEYSPITLERGVTHDLEFEQWANKVWSHAASAGEQHLLVSDFRKDIVIELYNEAEQKVLAYNVYRCWVSEFTAMPAFDANENIVAIQTMTLENEGWVRDASVMELPETRFEEA